MDVRTDFIKAGECRSGFNAQNDMMNEFREENSLEDQYW
jgi:hypothetical protein